MQFLFFLPFLESVKTSHPLPRVQGSHRGSALVAFSTQVSGSLNFTGRRDGLHTHAHSFFCKKRLSAEGMMTRHTPTQLCHNNVHTICGRIKAHAEMLSRNRTFTSSNLPVRRSTAPDQFERVRSDGSGAMKPPWQQSLSILVPILQSSGPASLHL